MPIQYGNFYETGVVCEVGIPNSYLSKFKTTNGKLMQFQKVLNTFILKLCEYKHLQVVHCWNAFTNHGGFIINENTEIGKHGLDGWGYINDFNYSLYNEVPQNPYKTVIRTFGMSIIIQVPDNTLTHTEVENIILDGKDGTPKEFKINGIPCEICICSSNFKELPNRNTGYVI